jgi:O-antigen/teichoic acid export membrane protein
MSKITAVLTPGKHLAALMKQSLFTNAGYLLGVNVLNAAAGFVFWSLAARLYQPEDIGISSAVISAVALIASVAGLGMNVGVVRFLPESQSPSLLLNTIFALGTMTSVAASGIFLVGLSLWSPSLIILQQRIPYIAGFTAFVSLMVLLGLTQMAFVARRQALYALFQAVIVNTGRLALVVFLTGFGSVGPAGSVLLATAAAVVMALIFFLPRVEMGYQLRLSLDRAQLGGIIPYSLGNLVSTLFTQTWPLALPLIVLEVLGPTSSGYAYIAWMLGGVLTSPGIALANSAFAEGSNSPGRLSRILIQAAGPGLLLTLSIAAIVGIAAPWVMLLFGADYAREASGLLRAMAAAAPMVLLSWLYFTRLRVQKRIGKLIAASIIVAGGTLSLAVILMPRLGILAIGIGWLTGNSLVALLATADTWREISHKRRTKAMKPRPSPAEKPSIVAAIPCYNEARFIGDVVRRTLEHVDIAVVVDDGSTDGTAEAAQAAGAQVIRHSTNLGPGAAARNCLQAGLDLQADILVTLDGDGQHNPAEILEVIAPILDGEADLVIGSRFLGRYNNVAAYRRFGIDVITFLYNIGSRVKITDGQSCFRAHNRRALETLQITEPGFGFSVETLVQARNAGLHIREASISCVYHEESHSMNPVIHGVGVALMVVKHRMKTLIGTSEANSKSPAPSEGNV